MEEEIWKDVAGYEGYYIVSNTGRVVGLDRPIINSNGVYRIEKRKELKQVLHSAGYLSLGLNKDGKKITKKIHRLVAIAFIPNPENKKEVNHIDGNKQNNNVSNLEWCTHKENIQHAFRIGLIKPNKMDIIRNLRIDKKIIIYRYSIDGDYIDSFQSILEAAKFVGGYITNISRFAKNPTNKIKAYGYKWSYEKRDVF